MLQQDILFADRYRLIKRIGQGGFAEVWLADDTLANLQVAIKIYSGMDEDGLKIFVKEINKVYHLNHTNLLKPQYVAAWNNMPYLVMTYCSAGSLEKKIGQITEQEAWKILHDVASGLAYLHSNNIIHQDIKPANILQDDMGNYVIIDFGISTLARDTLRKSTLRGNTSAGTLAYMGPERFSKDSTPIFASDIWSLGAMLFELLEGKTPFPADFGGGMQKAGAELPDISANVSNELKLVISKMLSLSTWDRPTADTLVEWTNNQNKQCIVVDAEIQGYVDLGLPSGTLWKKTNEGGDNARYTNSEAVSQFGNRLPTKQQLLELYNECEWIWDGNGCKVIGPSGNFIWLPAAGSNGCEEKMRLQGVGKSGHYWSAPYDSDTPCPWCISFDSRKRKVSLHDIYKSFYLSVRLVDCAKNLPSIENSALPTSKGLWEHVQQSQQSKPPRAKRWIWITALCVVFIYFLPTIIDLIRIDSNDACAVVVDIDGNRGDVYAKEMFFVELLQYPQENNNFYRIDGAEKVSHNPPQKSYEELGYKPIEGIHSVIIKTYHTSINGINIKVSAQRYEVKERGGSAVDLGLSVKWADCNLGATKPKNNGCYFAWGETAPKINYFALLTKMEDIYRSYKWTDYKWCNGSLSSIIKYNTNDKYGIVDNKIVLEKVDDAATKLWGDNWRLPTKEEFQELIDKCEWKKIELDDKRGYEVTSKVNGNRIFLPTTGCRIEEKPAGLYEYGYYWTNTINESNPSQAYMMNFGLPQGRSYKIHMSNRNVGRCIRPVCP